MKLTFVIGVQGGGKTSLTQELVAHGFTPLNRDTVGGSIVGLLLKLEVLLQEGKDVVLDNTMPTIEVRKLFIELGKQYNAEITCKWVDTSIEDAQFNVVARAIKLTGKFPTPEVIKEVKHTNIFPPAVLFKYRKEFEKPTVAEGFASVEQIKFVRQHDPSFTNKALILDYDSTLRVCKGGNGKYPVSEEQVEILPNRTEKLLEYQKQGYLLLGLSNQSGVHKGELTHEKATQLFEHTNKLLGVDIEIGFCPHQSMVTCYCRKPQTGLIVHYMLKHKLDLSKCIFVGDYKTDETAATRAGVKFIHADLFFK